MSETAKCPLCGDIVEPAIYNDYCECKNCWFRCDKADLPRIAAAMEYAKKTAYWFSLPDGIKHPDDARAEKAMTDAETRVLEVFNGNNL